MWVTYNAEATKADVDALAAKVKKTPYTLMSPVDDQADPIMLTAWGHQRTVTGASDPDVDTVLREVRAGRADARAGCRLHGRAAGQSPEALGLIAGAAALLRGARRGRCDHLRRRRGTTAADGTAPAAELRGRRVRAGHGGAPPAGRRDVVHRARPHRGRGGAAARVRHRADAGQPARHDDRLAGPVGAAEGVLRTDGLDGHGGMAMLRHSRKDGALMPGMATDAELKKLGTLNGKQAEILYLQLMTDHHKGGVHMAEGCVDQCTVGVGEAARPGHGRSAAVGDRR